MRVIMTGGGTAGHINPALSIANYIKSKYAGSEILFVGTNKGLEKELVPEAGFDIKYIKATGIRRKITLKNFKVILDFMEGSKEAKKIIEDFKPDVIIGTGGYVSFSTLREGYKKKIPTIIHEANSIPGIANKILSKNVDKVAVSFKSSINEFSKNASVEYTGNPLRSDILKCANSRNFEVLYSKKNYKVLVTGGSQGARNINNAVRDLIIKNKGILDYELVVATGKKNYEGFINDLKENGISKEDLVNIDIRSYIFDMASELNSANLVVGRCGAMTVSEITAIGIPAILIPLPFADKNYQELNARELENKGCAKVILDSELNGEVLNETINELLVDRDKLKNMAVKSYDIGVRDALERIDKIVKEIVQK